MLDKIRESSKYLAPFVKGEHTIGIILGTGLGELGKSNPDGTNAELYDLSKDANETQNLAAEHPGLTEELSKSLLAWWERRPRINIQKEVK